MKRLRTWLANYPEFYGILPALVALAILGYMLLGRVDPLLPGNSMGWLGELPVHTAYAIAALACAWIAKRLYLLDMGTREEKILRDKVMGGDPNARFLLIVDRLEWLALFALLLAFFWPPR